MNIIGDNIKRLRQKIGLNQSEVAKELEISTPAYSKIETGITIINLKRLNQIADFFKVTAMDILSEEGGNPVTVSADEISILKEKILLKDSEIIKLQKTAIELFEELRGR